MVTTHKELAMTTKQSVNSVSVLNTPIKIAAADAMRKQAEKWKTELPPAPTQAVGKMYTTEDIAKELNTSLSYVYMMCSKLSPTPIGRDGRTLYYDQAFMDTLKGTPRRSRSRKVKTILQDCREPVTSAPQTTGLLSRITAIEDKLGEVNTVESTLQIILTEIKQIKELLGI